MKRFLILIIFFLPKNKATNVSLFEESLQENYTKPFGDTGTAISAVILITLMLLGIILNSFTMAVIQASPLRKEKFVVMIFSLCCSDLLSSLISWIFLYRRTWGFDDFSPVPSILCTFYWAADNMTSIATAIHILCFAILRYCALFYPITYKEIKLKTIKIILLVIWIVSLLCGFVPISVWFSSRIRDRTSHLPDARWPSCTLKIEYLEQYKSYLSIAHPIFLYLPLVTVAFLSLIISCKIYSQPTNTQTSIKRSKQKMMVAQLLLIILSFLIGYVPISVYEKWSSEATTNTPYYKRLDYWFGMTSYMSLRLSETLNPIFYNLGSRRLRYYSKRWLNKHIFTLKSENTSINKSHKSRTNNLKSTSI